MAASDWGRQLRVEACRNPTLVRFRSGWPCQRRVEIFFATGHHRKKYYPQIDNGIKNIMG
jgi:hypothetical protein